MLRLFKRMAWMGVLAAGLPAAQAFSLIGPFNETWQVADLGYNINGDLGGPKNIGEDYRRNVPVQYYAFDETFLDYFGSKGVAAVDQAFAILNNLKPVSSYSPDLSEVPLEAQRFNHTAAALNLIDLKSMTLAIMMEQMGLADPIRYTWTLHDRVVGANCPVGNEYLVTKRNLAMLPSNLDQLQYSSYVNNVLFSYYIQEFCANPPPGLPLSDAVEIPVDVRANAARYTPVASFQFNSLLPGAFYTGLTRDDVAGLRYLLRTGHVHWEEVPANSAVFVPSNAPALLVTSNLTLLAAQSLTNDDAGLTAIYPGLVIVPGSTITSFSNVATANVSAYYVNSTFDPAGTPPSHLVYTTNYTTNVMTVYRRSFANVVTNSYLPVGFVTTIDTNMVVSTFDPPGVSKTNSVTKTTLTSMVSGDFYIFPTNLCDFQILSNVLTTAVAITNANTLVATNVPTNAISGTYLLSRTTITWFTNHTLAYLAVNCVNSEPGLRRGIEKVTFVKTAFDSMLGKFYIPQTSYFTMTTVTNSTNWVRKYQRIATEPDYLFTAADMMPGPAAAVYSGAEVLRGINFNVSNVLPGLAGPGIIESLGSNSPIVFNKSGPIFYNVVTNGDWFLEKPLSRQFMWASFDSSTNPPVVYPNGTSIAAIESQMMMQVTSTTLPPGRVGMSYTTQLTGTGGSGAPYIWSIESNSPTPPAWLGLTPVPSNGQLSGTPGASDIGPSSFFVRMTDRLDSTSYTVWQVTLTVLP